MTRHTHDIKYPTCKATGKIRFSSEATASRRAKQYDEIKRYYQCEHCGGWHLTSWSKKDYHNSLHQRSEGPHPGLVPGPPSNSTREDRRQFHEELLLKLRPFLLLHNLVTLNPHDIKAIRDAANLCDAAGIQKLMVTIYLFTLRN